MHPNWSPCFTTPALQQHKPPQWEAHTPQLESGPHSLKVEKAHMQQQSLSAVKKKRSKKDDLETPKQLIKTFSLVLQDFDTES